MSRKISRIKALQLALDAMCSYNQGNLSSEEMEAIDVIADMLCKLQLYERKRKLKYEGDKFFKSQKINGEKR